MALIALRKLNLQTCMRSNPLGLHVWYLVRPSVYFHTFFILRTAKAMARLCRCAVSPEPSLFAYAISTIILWAGSFVHQIKWIWSWKNKQPDFYDFSKVRGSQMCLFWPGKEVFWIFFLYGFYSPSKLFHSFWAESIVRWGENGRSPRKTTDHPQAELALSHMTRARLEPTAMRWPAI